MVAVQIKNKSGLGHFIKYKLDSFYYFNYYYCDDINNKKNQL